MKYLILLMLCTIAPLHLWADQDEHETRMAEVQKHFTELPLLPSTKDASGKSIIHFVDPNKHFFLHEGYRYFGFRFLTPAEIPGDFCWMFLMRNPTKPMSIGPMTWYILRKEGPMKGFTEFFPTSVAQYPALRAAFPHTRNLTLQTLDRDRLLPNEEYLIWFRVGADEILPDFAVAFDFLRDGDSDPKDRLPLLRENQFRSTTLE